MELKLLHLYIFKTITIILPNSFLLLLLLKIFKVYWNVCTTEKSDSLFFSGSTLLLLLLFLIE